MKSKWIFLGPLFGGLAFGLCVFAGIVLLVLVRRPLGPSLGLSTPGLVPVSGGTLQPVAGADSTATPRPLCGGPAVMNLLVIGSDTREDNYLYGLSDAIRLVRVDFTVPRVSVLEFPRDLWVQIPDISSHYGITHEKLNQAYLYGNPGMGYYNGPGQGPGLLARTLQLNFGASVDHYVAVNLQTFVSIVDDVGGLDVYLPYALDLRTKQYPDAFHITAGQHHLDGNSALWVARTREYTVFGRAQNQDIVLCALRQKLLSPAVLPKIPAMISDYIHNVQTDLSVDQVNQLACLATQMSGKNVAFASFPISLFKQDSLYDPMLKTNVFIWDADFKVLSDYVSRFQQGTWPDPNAVVQNTPEPDRLDAEFTCN